MSSRDPSHDGARRTRIRRRRAAMLSVIALLAACAGAVYALNRPKDHGAAPRHPRVELTARTRRSRAKGATAIENVYAHTLAGMFTPVTRKARYLLYAPDSGGDGVYVIDPNRDAVIHYFQTGAVVEHVVPAWDLNTLYATNDEGNSLTPINPDTGRRAGPNIPVTDPYNMYFTPDGQHAIVVEEAREVLAFRDPHSFVLQKALPVNCAGIDHMDFSADGRFALASCEFSGRMVQVDLRSEAVMRYIHVGGSPQDVKLSPDGRTFYVANRYLGGVQLIDAQTMGLVGFIRTAQDAHGLYVSRDTRYLYVSNRASGSVSVISFATRRVVRTWHVGGSPDMGGVSPDGRVLWLAGRYNGAVYGISTRTGKLIATIPAGISPHGLCVWPQPGRYSTGHTGVMR